MTHPQTQDDEALEKVARLFAETHIFADLLEYENSGLSYEQWIDANWRDFLPRATAALTALRNHEGRK